MKLSKDIIKTLQNLKGINLDAAFREFRKNGIDVKAKGFSENLVAMILDRELPKNIKGMDFSGLFEVKEIKVNFTKRTGEMRTGGDTAISAYLDSESNFFESNIWDKSRKILIICVDQDRVIVDIRFFDGEPYSKEMEKDYEAIKVAKNLCRQNNKFLVFKTGRNSIMLKGNTAIDFSESIITSDNKIENQSEYILNLFKSKFDSYKNKQKSNIDQIIRIMNRLSISELEKISEILKDRIKENFSFDLEAGSELDF
jgi:hypothetical protein